MNDTFPILIVLAVLVVALLGAAAPVSAALVRLRASRLPTALALRMEEEWAGELNSISSRLGKLAFAVALMLTRRRAFVAHGETMVKEIGGFGGRASLAILSTVLFALVAYGASFLVPVKYESETLLALENHDDLVLVQVRSNTFLQSVVNAMPAGGAGWRERALDDLRKNITVEALKTVSSSGTFLFLVKYRASDPLTAQNVTSKLMAGLIEQDYGQRIEQSYDEEKFLQSQLERLAASVRDKGLELELRRSTNGPSDGGMQALDHELLVSSYKAMFAKHQDAEMAASLRRTRLRVVDAPQLGKEIAPNRMAFAGIGALAGFVTGGGAVFGLGRRQRRLLASRPS